MSDFRRFNGLFITGTDTEVGKTIVTGGLAAILCEKGYNVGVMKPVETGCAGDEGTLLPKDAEFLWKMSRENEPLEKIVPYRFKEPLAPAVAAELEGVNIDIDKLVRNFEEISNRREFVLVEGVGGLLVPLSRKFLVLDLIKLFKLPILVISRAGLGAINHTLLTVRHAQAQKLTVAGIVINNLSPETSLAVKTNPEIIAKLTDIPIWGILPYQINLRPQASYRARIIRLIYEHLNLENFYKLL